MKTVYWMGSSKRDLIDLPEDVRREFGFGIHQAQMGERSLDAVPLVGYGGAGVIELKSDFSGDTYRAVYTVRFESAVYVLHAFQKKSKNGIATPKADLDLIRQRLKQAEEHYIISYRKKTEKRNVGRKER